jgi:uncharacterized metal-binding protein YceD (DUF177 family)
LFKPIKYALNLPFFNKITTFALLISVGMKWKREFEIAFVGLKQGEHHFNFKIKDSFFDNFANPGFEKSDIEVKMVLDKKPSTFLLHFDIHGKATTPCDRCGYDFEMTIWDEFDHVVKLVDDSDVNLKNEEDPEVSYVSKSDSLLDVSKLVYEYVVFSLPIQKTHGTDDESGESKCNQEVLKRLETQAPHTTNTMWDALKKKIKNENN